MGAGATTARSLGSQELDSNVRAALDASLIELTSEPSVLPTMLRAVATYHAVSCFERNLRGAERF